MKNNKKFKLNFNNESAKLKKKSLTAKRSENGDSEEEAVLEKKAKISFSLCGDLDAKAGK